jgi:hypothetical protein
MNYKVLLSIAAFMLSSTVFAIEDNEDNRRREADRYMETAPPDTIISEMTSSMAMNLPPEDREKFRTLMTKYIDASLIGEIMLEGLVNHFTADELAALADFYGSPEGRSAMSKFGGYMAETMPAVQAEVMRAVGVAQKEEAAANRQTPDPE